MNPNPFLFEFINAGKSLSSEILGGHLVEALNLDVRDSEYTPTYLECIVLFEPKVSDRDVSARFGLLPFDELLPVPHREFQDPTHLTSPIIWSKIISGQ